MIRDITIGQYYPVDSPIHRLDPRTKLFGTMIYIISLFFADNLFDPGSQTFEGAFQIHCEGAESNCFPAAYQR